MPLEKAIQDFWENSQIEHVEQVILSLKASKTLLKKRLGNSPAVIITEGFENWVDMNLPPEDAHFTLHPKRVDSFLDPDLVFGLNERTQQDGQVLQDVSDSELEFLASKLKMNQVKSVAICLMHSNKNASNEKKVSNYFSAQGIQTFCSSDTPPQGHERHRWLSTMLDAYLSPALQDQIEAFTELPVLEPHQEKFLIATSQGLQPIAKAKSAASLFGDVFLLGQHPNLKQAHSPIYFWGLEECFLIHSLSPQNFVNTEFGPLSLLAPRFEKVELGLTEKLQSSYWGTVKVGQDSVGFEPGPICFGRGLQPCLFDLLYLKGVVDEITPVSHMIATKTQRRIFDSLHSFVKEIQQELTDEELLDSILRICLFDIAAKLASFEKVEFTGPLGLTMKNVFSQLFQLKNIHLEEDFQFPTSHIVKLPKGGQS